MDQLIQIIEAPISSDDIKMDPGKLKFFSSKLKIWDYAKITASEFQNLSYDDKANVLKKYYIDICSRYSSGSGKSLFFFVCVFLFFVFFISSFLKVVC